MENTITVTIDYDKFQEMKELINDLEIQINELKNKDLNKELEHAKKISSGCLEQNEKLRKDVRLEIALCARKKWYQFIPVTKQYRDKLNKLIEKHFRNWYS